MKTFRWNNSITFLVFTLLLTSTGLRAQYWPVISKADTVNFKLSNNMVPMPDVTIWVLSHEVSGGDTILLLNRFVKGVVINQPGFLQKRVTIKPDGLVILSDTATYNLYPSAGIGTNWIFNPLTQTTASVTAITSEVVLGLPDSVKTISLSDGNIIRLSKRWGVLSFPDFLNAGILYNLVGIDNLRIGEYFPDHVDFALGLEVGDIFKTYHSVLEYNAFEYTNGYIDSYQYNVDSKIITDSTVEYQFYGIKQHVTIWFGSGEWWPIELYTGKLTYPLVFTASQQPDVWSRLRDKFSNDTIVIGERYGIVKCYYDPLLHSIGKLITGTPYNRLSNDILYFDQTIDTWLVWSSYNTCLGVPFVERKIQDVDNYSYTSTTDLNALQAWSKSFGSHGTFFDIGLTSENWPIVSDTNILNYQLSNNSGPLPDATISPISKEIINNDTILNLNRIVTKVEDQYLINQPGFLQKKVELNEDKSVVFSDPAEFMLYPSGGVGYYWLYDPALHTSAFIEKIEYQDVLGTPDTIKTILLSTGNRIKLSKKWGILSFPDPDNAGITYDLAGIDNQHIGKYFPDHTDYALGWDVGDIFRTREGSIEVNYIGNSIKELFTNKQFEVKDKTLNETSVSYRVEGFQWEEKPDLPVSYFPYNETIVFSLDQAPFIGHSGVGRMQDALVNDTLMTLFEGKPYIHVVEPYFDELFNSCGKRLVAQSFQAVNNDTLIIGQYQENGLISCEYQAIPGFPTINFSDLYSGQTLNDTIKKSIELIAWSTAEGSHGELIPNPLGISDQNISSGIHVYPNPFTSNLNIDLVREATYQRIEILNIAGISVFSADLNSLNNTFNLSNLNEGLYIVKVISDEGTNTMKVTKLK